MIIQDRPDLTRPLVFFVDDELDILDVFQSYFEHQYDIALFSKPEDAIAAAAKATLSGRPPDAIVTDFRMPKLSGLEMITRIRESGADTRAILLSGNLDKDVVIKAANRGVFRILEKPFDGSEIESALADLLIERRAEMTRLAIQGQVMRLKEMYSAMRILMTSRIPEFDEILREHMVDPLQPKSEVRFEDLLEELELSIETLLNDESFNALIARKAS